MAARFWVGGSGTWSTTNTTNWSATSGGAGGASVPGAADDVTIDGNSGSPTITTNYNASVISVTINAAAATLSLGGTLTCSGAITLTAGTFTTNNNDVTATSLSSSNSNTRTINLGSSTVTLNSAGIAAAISTGLTINSGTSNIVISAAGGNIIVGSSAGSGATFYNVSFTATGTATSQVAGVNTFNNFSVAAPSTAGVKQFWFNSPTTINGTLSTTGTAGNRRVWFQGVTYGIAQTLTINSAPSLTDADFRDIYVIGTAAPISGTRIGDLRGIRGITASTPKTVYWNLAAGGNWSANAWAASSGAAVSTDNFPLAQDTAVIENTGLNTSATVTIDNAMASGSLAVSGINMSTRTNAMTLTNGTVATTIYGDWTNGSGTTIAGTSALVFSGRNTQTITSAGKTFTQPITIDSYGGTVELAVNDINIGTNTLTVTNGTFDTKNYNVTAGSLSSSNSNVRTITLGSSTVTLTGVNFATSTNLTFNAGTSLINIGSNTVSISGGGVAFYDVAFTGVTAATKSVIGDNSFRNLTIAAPNAADLMQLVISGNQTITGTLTCTGATAVRRIFVRSDTLGTTRTLTVGTLSAQDCDFRDITIAGAAAGSSPTRAGDCGGNTGITFPGAKTVYWNLAGTQNWSATAWAPGSGGTPDINNFPLAQDTAVFDNTGSVTGTITVNANWNIGTFDASLRTSAMTLTTSTNTPTVYGDWKFGTGVTSSSTTGTITFATRGTETITSNGVSFGCPVTIDCVTGTVQLADALSLGSTRTLTLTSGTFDAVSYNVTTGRFQGDANSILRMGSGTWTLSGTSSIWVVSASLVFFKGTANIVLSDTSTAARTFSGAGLSYNKLTIGGTTGTSTLTISGDNQFTELASTKTVAHTIALGTTTQTFGKWTVTGTVGNVVTVTGTATITIAGACTSGLDYLALGTTTVSVTSPGEFYAGANSTATSAAAPLYLTAKPADSTRYWVGGTGNWSDTARWSTGSGGGSGASVPRSHDDVVFDSGSNATAYTATVNAVTGGIRMKSLTIAGPASGNVTLAGSTAIDGIHGNVTLPATGLTRTYTGAITLSSNSTGLTFTTNGVALASAITVNGVDCGWSLGSNLDNGTSTITVTNGTFNLNTYNITAAGSLASNNGNSRTINFNTGTITLSGATPINFGTTETNRANLTVTASTSQINISTTSPTFSGNNQTFYNVSFTSTSAGTVTLNGTNSFNNLSFTGITAAGLKVISVTANQTVTGTLTLSAGTNATMRTFVASNGIGTTRTLTCAAVASLTDIDFRDITIAGAAAPVSGTRLGDCKGNSGITFTAAANKYWNLAAGGNWGGAIGWATGSGGTPAINNFPLAQDTCFFESTGLNSGATVTINANYNIGTIDMSARTSNTMTLATGSTSPTIYGNWINGTGTTVGSDNPNQITFAGRGSQTITSAGKSFPREIFINTPGGSVTLLDALVLTRDTSTVLYQISGTFDANGYNVTLSGTSNARFTSTGVLARTVAIGSGTWTIASTASIPWALSPTNLTLTGTGTISMTGASAKAFNGGGIAYTDITLNQGGAGTLTISGNNTFKDITNTYKATGAATISLGTTTQRVSQFTAAGEAGRVLTVQGTSASSPGTLILTGATDPNVDYLTITGVRAYSLDTTWYAGANSTNNGSLGWYFEAGIVSITATVSETSTASDAVAAFLTFLSNTSETATATDSVNTTGTFNPSLSETATATDALAATLTLLAQVADAATTTDTVSAGLFFTSNIAETATATDATESKFAFAGVILESVTATDAPSTTGTFNPNIAETSTGTDAVSTTGAFTSSLSETATGTDIPSTANNTFNPSLAETATGTDSPAGNLSVTGAVSETTTATDTTQSAVVFIGAVSETATATDLISSLTQFLGQISENASITDVTLVAPSVFGPQVQEAVSALDSISTIGTFNVQLVESATALDAIIGAYLWNLIDDSQNPDWTLISDGYTVDTGVTGTWWATVASPSAVLMFTGSFVNLYINYLRVSTSTSAFGAFPPAPFSSAYSNSAYVNGYFYVFNYSFNIPLLRSIDGVTWETVNVPVSGTPVRCVFGNGAQLGIIQDTAVYISTNNGATWTGGSISFIPDGYGQAIWDGTKYVLVIGGQRRASLNGITWITVGNLAGYTHGFVAWNGNYYVTLRTSANASNISVSTNGTTYTTVPATTESSTAVVLELIDNEFIFINEAGEVLRLDAATSTFTKLGQVPATTYSRAFTSIFTFKKFQGQVYLSGSRVAPNTYLTTTDFVTYTVNSAPGWIGIDDSQNPNWQNVDT